MKKNIGILIAVVCSICAVGVTGLYAQGKQKEIPSRQVEGSMDTFHITDGLYKVEVVSIYDGAKGNTVRFSLKRQRDGEEFPELDLADFTVKTNSWFREGDIVRLSALATVIEGVKHVPYPYELQTKK